MRKTADWTKGFSFLRGLKEEEAQSESLLFTYSVEVPAPLEGKSLFETHCSLVCYTRGIQAEPLCVYACVCVCACANAYLNIPHPKTRQTMSVQVGERGKKGRVKEEETWQGAGQKRKRKKEKSEQGGVGGAFEEGTKAFLTLQLLLWQPASQYTRSLSKVAWRNREN